MPPVELIDLERELDALYRDSFDAFIEARTALAARLKKAGRADDAARVKALTKPSITAWAINQAYWHHRADFDALLAAGDRLRDAQRAALAGGAGDTRSAALARQQAIDLLVERALTALESAGSAGGPAMRQRVAATADALAAWGSAPGAPRPGRLAADIAPPGFAALAGLVPEDGLRVAPRKRAPAASTPPPRTTAPVAVDRRNEQRAVEAKRDAESARIRRALEADRARTEAKRRAAERMLARADVDARDAGRVLEDARRQTAAAEKTLEQVRRRETRAAENAAEADAAREAAAAALESVTAELAAIDGQLDS